MGDLERLISEWVKYEKIILAVDFDDTIFHWRHRTESGCKETLDLVKRAQRLGAYIMIHSCSDEDRYQDIDTYCNDNGLQIDSINKNPIDLPYGKQGKPYYNWQLCDRSGLSYASEILESAIKEVKKIRTKNI